MQNLTPLTTCLFMAYYFHMQTTITKPSPNPRPQSAKKSAKKRPKKRIKKGDLLKTVRNESKPRIVSKIDANLIEMFRLRYVNRLSYSDIAKMLNTSQQNVQQRLQRFIAFLPEAIESQTYEENKAKILNLAELSVLKQMFNPKKLEDASINNLAYAFSKLYEAQRLESGKSTANISYQDLVKQEQEILEALNLWEQKKKPEMIEPEMIGKEPNAIDEPEKMQEG